MASILRNRVAAVTAGAVVLGGFGSFAAVADDVGFIGSRDIQDGGVRQVDLRDGAIGRFKLTDALNAAIDKAGQPGPQGEQGAAGADGADGAVGSQGEKGEPGVPGVDGTNGEDGTDGTNGLKGEPGTNGTNGANGAPGVSNYQIVQPPAPFISAGGTRAFFVPCPTGTSALGGGFLGDSRVTVSGSYPSSTSPGWWIEAATTQNTNIGVYAICATVAQP